MCSIRPALQIPRVHSCLRGPQGIFVDMQCMQLDTSLESYDSIQQQPADHSGPLTYTCPEQQKASQPLKVNLFVHCCDAEEDSRCGKCYRSLERWLLGKTRIFGAFLGRIILGFYDPLCFIGVMVDMYFAEDMMRNAWLYTIGTYWQFCSL